MCFSNMSVIKLKNIAVAFSFQRKKIHEIICHLKGEAKDCFEVKKLKQTFCRWYYIGKKTMIRWETDLFVSQIIKKTLVGPCLLNLQREKKCKVYIVIPM